MLGSRLGTGVDKGGARPHNGRAYKNFFFGKNRGTFNDKAWPQASLQLNPVVHVTITQREGGVSIRCPTCILVGPIAYLIKIRKFRSKNLVHKGVNFEAQNALKLSYEHL